MNAGGSDVPVEDDQGLELWSTGCYGSTATDDLTGGGSLTH